MCQGTTFRLPGDELAGARQLQPWDAFNPEHCRAISDRGGSEALPAQGVSAQFCSVIHTLVHGGIPWCWYGTAAPGGGGIYPPGSPAYNLYRP